jgi:predicted RNA-binding protein Jag
MKLNAPAFKAKKEQNKKIVAEAKHMKINELTKYIENVDDRSLKTDLVELLFAKRKQDTKEKKGEIILLPKLTALQKNKIMEAVMNSYSKTGVSVNINMIDFYGKTRSEIKQISDKQVEKIKEIYTDNDLDSRERHKILKEYVPELFNNQ